MLVTILQIIGATRLVRRRRALQAAHQWQQEERAAALARLGELADTTEREVSRKRLRRLQHDHNPARTWPRVTPPPTGQARRPNGPTGAHGRDTP